MCLHNVRIKKLPTFENRNSAHPWSARASTRLPWVISIMHPGPDLKSDFHVHVTILAEATQVAARKILEAFGYKCEIPR
ncbi:hypothetical protein Y032_0086g1999 [Ancylostoma ceylanicum]|uniref:Uncharacterized protein n=1 Tax=Ancylostoma ceylanicum TaxID=53326 RepID=A0A016TPX9_9BILA|nr:hypothetical protein Y032_0086g1999 [Ancylostoma ceylanicum]